MRAATALILSLAFAGAAWAAPEGWHKSMQDGVAAAQKSGKPVLVVTMWKEKL